MAKEPKGADSAYIMACLEKPCLQYLSQNGLEMGSARVISFIETLIQKGYVAPFQIQNIRFESMLEKTQYYKP